MSTETEKYDGWTNRETWAVALYINNDQGWQESVHESLRDSLTAYTDEPMPAWVAGDVIKGAVEMAVTVDGYAEMTGEDHLPASLSRAAEDIGSLYRVNWDELGAAFLADIKES